MDQTTIRSDLDPSQTQQPNPGASAPSQRPRPKRGKEADEMPTLKKNVYNFPCRSFRLDKYHYCEFV